jgi:hypothetical protein
MISALDRYYYVLIAPWTAYLPFSSISYNVPHLGRHWAGPQSPAHISSSYKLLLILVYPGLCALYIHTGHIANVRIHDSI